MKIHICGVYGSGKSTLAKILSKKLGIKNYSLDDLKYEIKYSKIRSVEERMKKLQEICFLPEWVTEGTWSNYAEEAFKKADVVIVMNTSKFICVYRILSRHISREKHENDTLFEAIKLAREVFRYYFTKNPVSLYAHKDLIRRYKKRYLIIRKKSEIPKIIKKISKFNLFGVEILPSRKPGF
jgi:adenylate kinase family enzyme